MSSYCIEYDDQRILLYSLMQKMCAVMGVYMERDIYNKEKWKIKAIKDVNEILNILES